MKLANTPPCLVCGAPFIEHVFGETWGHHYEPKEQKK